MDLQNNAHGYLISDLTGDQLVDSNDYNILNNNLTAGWNDDYIDNCIPSLIGISELDKISVKIYPNPCKDFFTVMLDQRYNRIQFALYDVLGNACMNEMFEDESVLRINNNQLHTGIYVMKISADNRGIQTGVVVVNNE